MCAKVFPHRSALLVHAISHSDVRSFICKLCKKAYKHKNHLTHHTRKVHTDQLAHQCPICEKCFDTNYLLNKHVTTYASQQFECLFCNKKFHKSNDLVLHEYRTHSCTDYICYSCKKVLDTEENLKSHLEDHEDHLFRAFNCNFCGRAYTIRKGLDFHMRSHARMFIKLCDICGKQLSSLQSLKDHLSFHSDVRPHVCTKCGKRFSVKKVLKLHIKTHLGRKEFSCGRCDKQFTKKYNLERHIMLHDGIKPFKCGICPSAFVTKPKLNRHRKTHEKTII